MNDYNKNNDTLGELQQLPSGGWRPDIMNDYNNNNDTLVNSSSYNAEGGNLMNDYNNNDDTLGELQQLPSGGWRPGPAAWNQGETIRGGNRVGLGEGRLRA